MLNGNRWQRQDIWDSIVVKLTGAIAIFGGILVLLGWLFDIELLKQGGSYADSSTIKPNAAVCFVLAGMSLWLSNIGRNQQLKVHWGTKTVNSLSNAIYFHAARVSSLAIMIIGSLTAIQYVFGWNFGIDELLFRDSPTAVFTPYPGRMGFNAAINFLLLGRALELAIYPKTSRSYWYSQILTLIAGVITVLALAGYAYDVHIFYSLSSLATSMALHAAILFMVLCTGILSIRVDQGLMRVVMSESYGGLLARRLLIAALTVPLLLGWLILRGMRLGHYDAAFSIAIFAVILIVIFSILVWQCAAVVDSLYRKNERHQKTLRAYEAKLKSFVDANVIGIILGDVYGNIYQANDRYLEIIGYTREDFLNNGIKWNEITPLDDLNLDEQAIAQAQTSSNGACHPYEKVYIRKDGSQIRVLVGFVLVGEEREEALAFIVDLSERQKAAELLQNQQKWLEYILNLMPIPLLFVEPETARVTFANYAANELAGGDFPKGIPAEDYHTAYYCTDNTGVGIPNHQMPGVRVARGEHLQGVEMDWHTSQGVRSLLIFGDTFPAMYSHPPTGVVTFQDVTTLKEIEKALSRSNQKLQLLFSTASALLSSENPVALVTNLFHQIKEQIHLDIYFNYLIEEDNSQVMRLASYIGVSEELAKEIEFLELGQAVCGTAAQCRQAMYVENVQQSTKPETALIRSLGIQAYYCYPLVTQGQLFGTLSFASCTHSYFTENQIGMMQAVCSQMAIAMQRSSLIISLQQQTEQLQAANRMKDEFLAILSHELRSPLNAILGWAQLLRSRRLNDTQIAKALETIERNAKTQTQMIEDLLDISRMIRGKLQLRVTTCNLVSIIQSTIETVALAAQAKEINLQFLECNTCEPQYNQEICKTCTDSPPLFLISGDGDRLQQIIWNLLSNAIKFTPQGGKITITICKCVEPISELGAYAQIQIIDTGIGIKPDFLPYVFDRFRQADSSNTRAHGGLGLGLAIVRHLVELHGGTVHVESMGEGKGTTFTVKLPLLLPNQETTTTSANLSPADSEVESSYPSLADVRVLIVDDEADTREYVTTVLQQCQAKVEAVSSVQEALQKITQWLPDVIVSDIAMPGEDGYSLIRQLRSQPVEQGGKIPAAALTAYARAEDRMRAIQEGFQLHLPKPIEPAELVTVVASLVGKLLDS